MAASSGVYSPPRNESLNAMSRSFHDYLRARPSHPRLPRPIHLNTWEAVYFDHDIDRLRQLASVAAELGVERFVLDDGWFGSRRDDTRGLGDWQVSPEVWPDPRTPGRDGRFGSLHAGFIFHQETFNSGGMAAPPAAVPE